MEKIKEESYEKFCIKFFEEYLVKNIAEIQTCSENFDITNNRKYNFKK